MVNGAIRVMGLIEQEGMKVVVDCGIASQSRCRLLAPPVLCESTYDFLFALAKPVARHGLHCADLIRFLGFLLFKSLLVAKQLALHHGMHE